MLIPIPMEQALTKQNKKKSKRHCLQPPLKTVGFSMMLYFSVCAGLEEHIIYLLKV